MTSFDLNFSIEGWTLLSFADQLRLSPLFFSGQTPIFTDANSIMGFSKDPSVQKKWLPLQEVSLSVINTAGGHIQPVKNELFTVDQVAVTPKEPMSWERWLKLIEQPTLSSSPNGSNLLLGASLILLAWLTRKKIPFIIIKIGTVGTESVKIASRFSLWMFGTTKQICWRWLPQLNLLIGLIALGPGIWIAGLQGWSFAGIMVLVLVGLVTWGAFCHWREQTGRNGSEYYSSLQIKFFLLALSFGCAIWSLGQYKLSNQALWGLLPILGMIYIFLPTIYRLVSGVILRNTHYVRPAGWFITGMALYGLGFLAKSVLGSGKTFFFALGGLSIVFAIRAGLLILEPELRSLSPFTANLVYGRTSNVYFSSALVMLVVTAIAVSFKIEQIAEQLGIIVYYCLAIGIVMEIVAPGKPASDGNI